jgi:hypothetical protein
LDIAQVIVIILGVVLVIGLTFLGFQWVKPDSLRLKLKWNCLEFELRREPSADVLPTSGGDPARSDLQSPGYTPPPVT